MNPLDMMKFKGMFEKFVTRHPMLPKFFARIQPEVKEGSVIELTVTPPDGEPLKAEDMELLQMIKNMQQK